VPVAEPSGEYKVKFSVDLSPFYGLIKETRRLTITQPPADILEQRLDELKSSDASKRRAAAVDLAHFQDHADRVFLALIAAYNNDKQIGVRSAVVQSMGSFAAQIKKRPGVLISALCDKKMDQNLRVFAAFRLGHSGLLNDEVEKALQDAIGALEEDGSNELIRYALDEFNGRRQKEAKN